MRGRERLSFLIAMYDIPGVEILGGTEQLVHDEPHVHVFQNIALAYHVVEVGVHELKHQVQVVIVLGSVHVKQLVQKKCNTMKNSIVAITARTCPHAGWLLTNAP